MKLYKVEAKEYGYDEYDSFVVWAENPEEALALVKDKTTYTFCGNECCNFTEGAVITELKAPSDSRIILGSFNAG